MEDILLRPIEAGRALGLRRTTIYRLIKTGQLAAVRLGTDIRIPAEDLRQFAARLPRVDTRHEHDAA